FGPEKFDDPNYNLPLYDPLWSAISDAGIAATFHVGTGRDPRVARKNGGAVINLTWGARATAISTLAHVCASGLLDRHPRLRFAIIEAGVGWVPWTLESMDEAYRKHHMWVQPKLKRGLPSEYFRAHGFASFEEDVVGIALVESMRLENSFLWANDYPHAEGTWPHSAAAIERQMGGLREGTRRNLLGENACRLLGLDPAELIARRRTAS
ncbi:MAG: amidohydrolase family protein, partial [Candidatus Binatia bacterium]